VRCIIDTHVFLWSLFDPKKLSKRSSEIISDIENTIYVSIISFWEISLKYNSGKIELNNIIPDDLPSYAENSGFEILNPDPSVVATFHRLPSGNHKDPFDRLIIRQSIKENITLISKDAEFADYNQFGLKTLW